MTTSPKHAPRTPFVLLVLGLLVGGMCLLLALNTASAANEVARHDLAGNDESASAQLVELENEVQASAAPANLAAAAAALGMVPAGNPGFLEIGKHGRVRMLGSASPASALPVVIPHPAPTKTKTKTKTKAKTKAKTTAATTKSAEPSKTASPAPTKSDTPTRTTGQGQDGAQPAKSSSQAPSPTPTPTPETTLPGGNR
jgi:hypothetical protein